VELIDEVIFYAKNISNTILIRCIREEDIFLYKSDLVPFKIVFLLFAWSKSNKKSRLYKNTGGSKPKVSPRNTRHERWHKSRHLSLLCIATHIPSAHTSDKNRWRIFIRPVPTKRILLNGNIAREQLSFTSKFSGCQDRPYRNFTTDVAEGKTRRHVGSKTPASRAFRMMFQKFQALFCEPLPRHTDV
jgi:hypothetical protein